MTPHVEADAPEPLDRSVELDTLTDEADALWRRRCRTRHHQDHRQRDSHLDHDEDSSLWRGNIQPKKADWFMIERHGAPGPQSARYALSPVERRIALPIAGRARTSGRGMTPLVHEPAHRTRWVTPEQHGAEYRGDSPDEDAAIGHSFSSKLVRTPDGRERAQEPQSHAARGQDAH